MSCLYLKKGIRNCANLIKIKNQSFAGAEIFALLKTYNYWFLEKWSRVRAQFDSMKTCSVSLWMTDRLFHFDSLALILCRLLEKPNFTCSDPDGSTTVRPSPHQVKSPLRIMGLSVTLLYLQCFLKLPNAGLFFVYLHSFQRQYCRKNCRLQWDSNWDSWIEGERADHLTTTTALFPPMFGEWD